MLRLRNRASRKSATRQKFKKRLRLEALEDRRLLATFAVNSVGAEPDGNVTDGICDTGSNSPDTDPPFITTGICTFTAASMQADHAAGMDLITFDEIGGTTSPLIAVGRGLGFLHPVTIDGTTHASGRVMIGGSLSIMDSSTVKGLAIVGHSTAFTIGGNGNVMTDTYVGYDATGIGGATDDSGNVFVQGNNNTIGTATAAERNVISGGINITGDQNLVIGNYFGMDLTGGTIAPGSSLSIVDGQNNFVGGPDAGEGNVFGGEILVDGTEIFLRGNRIGTNADGTAAIDPNGGGVGIGISVRNGASDVQIGGDATGEGNLISGKHFGVFVGGTDVRVWGNQIGTNAAGDAAIPNLDSGILIGNQILPSVPNDIEIGGIFPEQGNLISGNPKGIKIVNAKPSELLIANNFIGTNKAGTAAIANETGISVENSEGFVIGGEDGNLISGNTTGVLLAGPLTTDVHVLGNLIGTSASGAADVGNVTGIFVINGAHTNAIGGRLPDEPSGPVLGNVISGSDARPAESLWGVGVWITGSHNNSVQGNRIGTNAEGTLAIGNEGEGVLVFQSRNTVIGGSGTGEGNQISGNGDGVLLWSTSAAAKVTGTTIAGNLIGTDATGTAAISNDTWGVHLTGHVENNDIGGDAANKRNIISGNKLDGIIFFGEETTNNRIHGNFIGTDITGMVAVPNERSGILIDDSPANQIGFRPNATFSRNVISGNQANGVTIQGDAATENVVEANLIGVASDGLKALGNELNGLVLEDVSETTVGGETANDRNVISGNAGNGLVLQGAMTTENEVFQNYIGLNLPGDAALGNAENGLVIDGAPENVIGKIDGTEPFRNLISGNAQHGLLVTGATAIDNVVHGNFIGLGVQGTEQLGNQASGVAIIDADKNLIGNYALPSSQAASPMSRSGNFISDNRNSGILLQGTSKDNQIVGNGIGTSFGGVFDPQNNVYGNQENGVQIVDATNNFIGSYEVMNDFTAGRPAMAIPSADTLPAKLPPNVIVASGLDGVRIQGTASGNRILNNKLHHNGSQGIDLGDSGIEDNDNDDLDADEGANTLQNYPEIVSMVSPHNSNDFVITANFTSKPNEKYLIQTFSNSKRSASGQGETVVDTQVVTTGADGKKLVTVTIPKPARGPNGEPPDLFFAMTATNAQGNTSEFSPSATVADLLVEPFSISVADIEWEGTQLIWSKSINVCNDGGREANNVKLTFKDNFGDPISPGAPTFQTLDFPAKVIPDVKVCHTVPLEWDITNQMKTFHGNGEIGLEIDIDVEDSINESDEDNVFTTELDLDVRPQLAADGVITEFKPGHFVEGVSVTNEVVVENVDWNGDLPGKLDTGSVTKELFFAAGTARDSADINSSFPHAFEFDIGRELFPGSNEIRVEARTIAGFEEGVWTQTTNIVDVPAWLASVILNKKESGSFGKRVALYTQKIGFPGIVTEGFFGIPASEIKVAKGDIGPSIGEYELAFEYRSDGDGTLAGKAPWSGKVGGLQVLPPGDITLAGTVNPFNNKIFAKKLEATWSVSGEKETPRIRLAPPFSMFEVFAVLQGGASVKVGVEQTEEGELDWQSVQFGLTGGAIGMIGAGYKKLLSVSGGIGARISPTFNLSGEPCFTDSVTAQMVLRAQASALGFTTRYELNIPDPAYQFAGCGGQAGGEGHGGLTGEGAGPDIVLSPHTGGDWFATLNAGLPDIRYEFAAPALSHHVDGSKTLIWVDEDPNKPTHERLEIVSSRFVGGVWQTPVVVSNDSRMDYQPTITTLSSGKALAVWAKAVDPIDTSSPYTNLASFELFSALYDPSSDTWSSPELIGASSGMDYLPNLTPTADGASLAYFNDPDGDTSLFPDDGKSIANTLLVRSYDTSTGLWSSASSVVSNVDSATAPQVILGDLGGGVDGLAIWNENIDGLSGGERQRVAVARGLVWETPIILADEPVSGITATQTDPAGGQMLAWVQSEVQRSADPNDLTDQLWFSNFSGGVASDPILLHEAGAIGDPVFTTDDVGRVHLTWLQTIQSAVEVYSMSRGANGVWGKPRQVSVSSDMPWWLMPWVEGDELKVLHLSREVVPDLPGAGEGESGDLIGQVLKLQNPTLAMSTAPLGADLVVQDLWFTNTAGDLLLAPLPGQTIQARALVENIGDFASGPNSVSLTFAGGLVASSGSVTQLDPGEQQTIVFTTTLPQTPISAFTLAATVDSNQEVEERDEANNVLERTALKPDLAISDFLTTTLSDRIVLEAVVTNVGNAPTIEATTLILRLDQLVTGASYVPAGGVPPVPPLAPGEQHVVQLEILNPSAELGGPRTGFLILDPATTDSISMDPNPHGDGNTANNFVAAPLRPVLVWQNTVNHLDVNNDGFVSPIDALIVINDINRLGARALPVVPVPPPFIDPSGDDFVSAIDALLVINFLNRGGGGEAEPAGADAHDEALLAFENDAWWDGDLMQDKKRAEDWRTSQLS